MKIKLPIKLPDFVNYDKFISLVDDSEWGANCIEATIKALILSKIFNHDLYLKKYPDVKNSNLSAEEHYVKYGFKENRQGYFINNNDVSIQFLDEQESNSNIKVSIIVPVYNVEKYLEECIDSLVKQTLQEIEIICINDGSTDKSNEILNDYKSKDSRIIIIDQDNMGQGTARNRGIEYAHGKYIQFLDSDDFLEQNCCEKLYNIMEQYEVDIACFQFYINYESNLEQEENDITYYSQKYKGLYEIKYDMLQSLDCNCWNKIFKRSFINDFNIRFPEGVHFEDNVFFWYYMTSAKYIYFIDDKLMTYRRRSNSFMSDIYNYKFKNIDDFISAKELIYKYISASNILNSCINMFINRFIGDFHWILSYLIDYRDKISLIDKSSIFLKKIDLHFLNQKQLYEINHIIEKNYYAFKAIDISDINIDNLTEKEDNIVNIVFNVDNNYGPFFGVCLQSLVYNTSNNFKYAIFVLTDFIDDINRYHINNIVKSYTNISLKYIDVSKFINIFDIDHLTCTGHINKTSYYRLLCGDIFKNYKRVLYLDSDLVINFDISELFFLNLQEYPLAAVPDVFLAYRIITKDCNTLWHDKFSHYLYTNFGFKRMDRYFNSGVLVIDIKKFNSLYSSRYLFDLAHKNKSYFNDQNILNIAFENNYLQLDYTYNLQWHIKDYDYRSLNADVRRFYDDMFLCPKIIHYCSHIKPWNNVGKKYSDYWWKFARLTPYYEPLQRSFLLPSK